MQRSTSRTITFSVVAALFCLLLVAKNTPAQSALEPPPQSSSQPSAQGSMPRAGTSSDTDNPLHTASRAELDVVKVLVAQEHAWNDGDVEGFMKGYKDSPETIFIGKDVAKGYQQIFNDYKRDYTTRASMGNLVYSELVVTTLSDTFAICTGKYHVDRTKKEGGPADGLFSLVLEKTAEGWKIVLDHTT
jgi:ketosteroid isomerase-like protein